MKTINSKKTPLLQFGEKRINVCDLVFWITTGKIFVSKYQQLSFKFPIDFLGTLML